MMRWLHALFGGKPKPASDAVVRDAHLALLLAERELNRSRRLRAANAKYDARLRGRP